MESDPTLISAVDAETTATGPVDQRFSVSGCDAEPLLDLTFVVGMVHPKLAGRLSDSVAVQNRTECPLAMRHSRHWVDSRRCPQKS